MHLNDVDHERAGKGIDPLLRLDRHTGRCPDPLQRSIGNIHR
jgi:hypothetical protein